MDKKGICEEKRLLLHENNGLFIDKAKDGF
jgi:hypothetical protein